MSNTILIKRSGTASAVPASGNLALGELAINYTDGNLFYKDNTNAIKIIASNQFSSVTGNVTANNGMFTNIVNSASFTGGLISVTGDTTAGNLLTGGLISATGNITGNYILGNGYFLTGVITSVANINNGTSNITVVSSGGNIAASVGGTANIAVWATTGQYITGVLSANGNVTGGNLLTSGLISATGNITGGNVNTVLVSATTVSATGNVTGGNISTAGYITANGGAYGEVVTTPFASVFGTGSGPNPRSIFQARAADLTAGIGIQAYSGINGQIYSNTGITFTTGATIRDKDFPTGGTTSATIDSTGLAVTGIASATGNITGGNISTGGLISALGNITSSGNVSAGNVLTAGQVSAAGNISTGANVNVSGYVTVVGNIIPGNVTTAGVVSAQGNVIAGNVNTVLVAATTLSATGNVNGGNINTNSIIGTNLIVKSTGFLDLSATGDINITPTGNIVLPNTYINGLAQPVQNQDAATKLYVDNLASTGITYHEPVFAATNTTLETATGGTITYAQPNGAGNGVGATLTTTGAFYLIDTANVQTVGTRILVQTQANAVQNGIYTYANTTAIVRSTDADQYGSNSTEEISINDYFFVQSGNTNSGAAFIVSAPAGTITFGTSNIVFAQFSSSQSYSANIAAGLALTGTVFSAKVDNDTTAFDGTGNIIVKTSANLVTPNIGAATGTSLSTTGNLTGGNLVTAGIISAAKGIQNTPIGNAVANTGAFTTLTANGAVTFTSNVESTGYTTGAVVLSGGMGVAGNIELPGTAQIHVGSELGGVFPGSQLLLVSNVNSYSQAVKQNQSEGGSASSDWVAVANNGDDTNFYIDMGINSNNYSDSAYTATGPNDGYLYVNGGNLVVGTQTQGKNIIFNVGNTVAANIVATLSYDNLTLVQNTISTTVGTGALVLSGTNAGLGVAGNINAGGNITGGNITTAGKANIATLTVTTASNVTATTISTSSTTGAMTIAGGLGVAGNIYGGALYDNGTAVLTINSTVDGGTY